MSESKLPLRVLISGGGTGGHIFPAIAIADAVKKKVPNADILFVGAIGKMEMEKVPKAGYTIKGLWISGFYRKLTLRNLLFPLKLVYSLLQALNIVIKFKPQVAVGVGGFASGPVLRMATRMGVPSLIQEQNSYAGVTNRILSGKVNKICVAYPQMERYFPADKIVVTGNPVRADLSSSTVSRAEAVNFFGLDAGQPVILVFGGSLGALRFNEAMAASEQLLRENAGIQVIWQMGAIYYERFKDCATAQLPNVKALPFLERMDMAYAAADLVVCRAGALTIAELCLLAKPSMLVPSPNVAEDHQTKNARALADRGAALMLSDREAAEGRLLPKALEALNNKELLQEVGQKAAEMAYPNAAERIAEQVLALAGVKTN